MKFLNLLIATLMMSSIAFSQTATDTTKIALTKPIARLVIKDLVKGDAVIQELAIKDSIIVVKDSTINKLESIMLVKEQRITNLNTMLLATENKYKVESELNESLQQALKKEKRKNFFFKVGTGGVIVTGVALLILTR